MTELTELTENINNLLTQNNKKQSTKYFYKDYIFDISNKFLTISLHITIMIIFEIYFYFEFAIKIEKTKFIEKINNIFKYINKPTIEEPQQQKAILFVIEEINLSLNPYNNYKTTIKNQNKLLKSLINETIQYTFIISIPTIIFIINALYNHKIIKWKWVLFENILMLLLLGIFEYIFFVNIILKYDPITDDEIAYLITEEFINYLNQTIT